MSTSIEIVLYESGPKGNLYTIRQDGKDITELESFFEREDVQLEQFADAQNRLKSRIEEMVDAYGFQIRFFRDENRRMISGNYHICALLRDSGFPLRLYCIWLNENVIVAGSGGVKIEWRMDKQGKVQRILAFQDDNHLDNCQKVMELVASRLRESVESGETIITEDGYIQGNLQFTV